MDNLSYTGLEDQIVTVAPSFVKFELLWLEYTIPFIIVIILLRFLRSKLFGTFTNFFQSGDSSTALDRKMGKGPST